MHDGRENRRVILVMPDNFDFLGAIKKNLEFHGYSVIAVNGSAIEKSFSYPSLYSKLHNAFRKVFFRDKSIKELLKAKWRRQCIHELLGNRAYDKALFIRPDLVHEQLIGLLKPYVRGKMIAYQWDGFLRNPGVVKIIPLFDRFFVFDPKGFPTDKTDQYILGITNFYFDFDSAFAEGRPAGIRRTAYFIGTHQDSRVEAVSVLSDVLLQQGVRPDFHIAVSNRREHKKYGNRRISFMKKMTSYEENLRKVRDADILIDLVNPIHSGLSFRIFEALHYGKKIITNNRAVKLYDFYHPNNIFVFEDLYLEGLETFLASPIKKLSRDIVGKYGFGNWIRNVLDEHPYITIGVPDTVSGLVNDTMVKD